MDRKPRCDYEDPPIVPPPATLMVTHDHVAILYLPNGKVLVKRAGF